MLNNKYGISFVKAAVYVSVIIVVISVLFISAFVVLSGLASFNLSFLFDSIPLVISTLMVIFLALLIAVPLGVFSAVYMQMYAKKGRFIEVVRFSIDSLTGIPSIIYGLFALSLFVYFIGFSRSILVASLGISIVVLPLLIKNTEEAIKTIDRSQIEASLALGATRYDTIKKVVIPFCLDGILNGIILSVGRIIGETAAIMFVIGSLSGFPTSYNEPGSTLAVQLYLILQEPTYSAGGINDAYSLALILLFTVILLNLLVKIINTYFRRKRGY